MKWSSHACFEDYLCQNVPHGNAFRYLYCNARSLKSELKFEQLKLRAFEIKPDIILIAETWFKEGDSNFFVLDGYCLFESHRTVKRGGGIGIYVRLGIISSLSVIIETSVSILQLKIRNLSRTEHVVLVYKPPNVTCDELLSCLESVLLSVKEIIFIFGDFNLNLLDSNECPNNNRDLISSFNLIFVRSELPTRGNSLIDHVIKNTYSEDSIELHVIQDDFSDHSWLLLERTSVKTVQLQQTGKYLNYSLLEDNFKNSPLSISNDIVDPELCANLLSAYLEDATNKSTITYIYSRGGVSGLPWVTKSYLNLRKRKDNWYASRKRYPFNPGVLQSYKSCANLERKMRRK